MATKKPIVKEKNLTPQQDEFCRLYTSWNKLYRGNATQSYIKAYKLDVYDEETWKMLDKKQYNVWGVLWGKLLKNIRIKKKIDKLLDEWFSDKTIDNELSYVIKQNEELSSKVSAIKEANRLKARVREVVPLNFTIDLTDKTPKQLMEYIKKVIDAKK